MTNCFLDVRIEQMKIIEKKKGNSVVYQVEGRLDSTTSPDLEKKILNAITDGSENVILDLALLDYLSSAGIRILVQCHKALEKQEGHIVLASVPKPIENILYITGFLPYFQVFDNSGHALEAIEKNS